MAPITSIAQALELSDEARVITLGRPPYQIVHTNQAWYRVTGYKFTEIANQTSAFLQGPDTEREYERALVKALAAGRRAKVRLLNYTKEGVPFFNQLECFPLHDSSGTLTHFVGTLRSEPAGAGYAHRTEPAPQLQYLSESATAPGLHADNQAAGVSRRPTMEAASPSSSRPKRHRGEPVSMVDALNNSTDAVVLTQPQPPYAITHVNQPWCVMCGYSQEEVEGLPNSILHGPETDQAILSDLMSSVQRGEPTSATLVNYKKGGVRFVNQVTVKPVYNEDDELEQFMAMLHEVDGVGPSRA